MLPKNSFDVSSYEHSGYGIVEHLLDAHTVLKLLGDADSVIACATNLDHSSGDFNLEAPGGGYLDELESRDTAYRGVVRKVSNYVNHSPAALEVSQRPEIVCMVGSLLGGNLDLVHSILWCKPPRGAGSAKPPHQDAPYLEGDPRDFATVWIALDRCTPENGCLYMIPTSHVGGLRDHHSPELQVGPDTWRGQETEAIILEPGSAVLFHPYTLHASGMNHSDGPRRALMLRYRRVIA